MLNSRRGLDLHRADLASMKRGEAEAEIRARVQTSYLGNGVVLTRVLGRQKIFLRTLDRGFACHVMLDGHWEIWLTLFFARYIKPAMTIIDVGANFGYYTLLFADAVGPRGRVIAVEPSPETAVLLRETIDLNGIGSYTTLVAAAAGAEPSGTAHLFVPTSEPKNATVVAGPGLLGGDTLVVPSTNLDTMLPELNKVDLVKIDAEGAEVGILAGMRQMIARDHPAIVLEFNAARYPEAKTFLQSLLDVYGAVSFIDYDGHSRIVSPQTVLTERYGEDWMLLFDMAPARRSAARV